MTLIPEGTWRARALTAELGFTSKDDEQVGIQLVFSPGQHPDVDGRYVIYYGQFGEKSMPHTLKALRTCGWAGDSLADLSGIDANEVEVVVGHEQDLHGEWRARPRFINPIGSGGVAMKSKMSTEQAAAFAARMRGAVLASKGASAPQPSAAAPAQRPRMPPTRRDAMPAPSNPANAIAAPEDDTIPFIFNDAEQWGERWERWTAKHAERCIF